MAKNFINKAKTLSKKLAIKIGQSKFTEKFIYNFLDTIAFKIIGILVVATAIVGYALPLMQYQPFYWDIPAWMTTPALATVTAIAWLITFAVGIPAAIIGICSNIAIDADTVEAVEAE